MVQGARICPRCSARVDERRARTSPYCLSCGSPLGAPSTPFAGKKAGGSSALPWILGAVALVALLVLGGAVALIAVVVGAGGSGGEAPAAAQAAAPGPPLESTSTTGDAALPPAVKSAASPAAPRPPTPRPPATVIARPQTAPTVAPPPPTAALPPDAGVVALGPFPRAQAQAEVDRVASGLASCKRADGPFGAGSIRVDFEPDGRVGTLSRPPFSGTAVGSCISSRFLAVRVGKFAGSTQRIERTFIIQE
jgi:hypothetical protein